jgi:DNA-binding response OmpR family regulator
VGKIAPKPQILIVDDNPTNLEVIADYLEDSGFDITVARDGESVLDRMPYTQPDLILLDVMMPDMDGFQVCYRLKADEATKDIPIIFMTVLAGTQDKVKSFAAGAVDYVTKPIQKEEILIRIKTHLTIQQQKAQLQKAKALLSKRATQLETSSQVGQHITSILDLEQLLSEVAALIQAKFGYYLVGIWLLDEEKQEMVLRANYGHGGTQPLESGLALSLDLTTRIIVSAGQTGEIVWADNVREVPDWQPNEFLPDTYSELAVPIIYEGKVLGVLDVQEDKIAAFDKEDAYLLRSLSSQVAMAIKNTHTQ